MALPVWTRVWALAVWVVCASSALAQGAPADARSLSYDVASLKPNKSGSGSTRVDVTSERYSGTNVSLKTLIRYAYDIQSEDVIFGLPSWAESAHYDVECKVDAETLAALRKMSAAESVRQRRAMMRAMLADRFQLRVHPETRELPVFALVVAKGGAKLKEADPKDTYANGLRHADGVARGAGSMDTTRGSITAQAVSIENLATNLSPRLHREVIDKTGLSGKYDFALKFAPDEPESGAPEIGPESLPSLFTALEEQLGLKLESAKGPVSTVVVDRVAIPVAD